MVERRAEVVARLKSLEEAAAPLVTFLLNPAAVQELRADKQFNLQMLKERYQVCVFCLVKLSDLCTKSCLFRTKSCLLCAQKVV